MSCATARMANPNDVRCITNHRTTKIATVPPRIRQSAPETVTPPIDDASRERGHIEGELMGSCQNPKQVGETDEQTDARDQRDDARLRQHWTIDEALDQRAEDAGDDHRADNGHEEAAGEVVEVKPQIGAGGVDAGMRDVQNAQHAIDHRKANRDHRVNRPERQRVDELLADDRGLQGVCHGSRKVSRSARCAVRPGAAVIYSTGTRGAGRSAPCRR